MSDQNAHALRKFKPGDVVQMKSGGPYMVVIHMCTRGADELAVLCEWFCEKDHRVLDFVFFEFQLVDLTKSEL